MSALAVAEIGGTSIKIGFADAGQPLPLTRTWPTAELDAADPARSLAGLVRAAAAEAGVSPARLVATVPGFIDRDGDTILHTANVTALNGLPLASRLSAALGLPVTLERDAVLQLLGEAAAGAVAGEREVLAIFLGTGIGAAYLGAGGIFRGGGWALELGHMPRAPSGRIEDVASGARVAEIAAAAGVPVADAFRTPALAPALDEVVDHLARAAASASVLFSPRLLLLGGGVTAMAGFPLERMQARFLGALPRSLPAPEIRRATLGWQAAIHGALTLP